MGAAEGWRRYRRGRWVRLGGAATSVAMTLALLGTAWVSRHRTGLAVRDVDESEGEVLLRSVRQSLRDLPLPPTAGDLRTIISRHESDGLRSIEFYGSHHQLIARAGSPSASSEVAPVRPGFDPPPMAIIGDRVRMSSFFRPTRDSAGGGVGWGPWESSAPQSPSPSIITVEFEPLVERALLADANLTFEVAALAGAVLVAAAFVFWRMSERHEQAQQRIEQERRLGVLGEMSAVLAHEIRNPLASLKGNAQLLARRLPQNTAESRKAERVVHEAERLEALTSDLLDFARSGPMDVQPADPTAVLAACVEEVAPRGFDVRSEDAPRVWPLDAARLRQALTNVLRNALQASPPGTMPEVTIGQDGPMLVFAVRDHGEGIRAGDEERLFVPFFTTRPAGTGLGLTVARRIAELHGGTIVAFNHAKGGAVFRITLSPKPGRAPMTGPALA